MELHNPELQEAGLQMIAVALGEPKHIERYCGKLAPSLTCLTGEQGGEAAYNAYGLQEGHAGELFSFDVLKAGARAFKDGHRQGETVGNAKMMPGTFIVDQSGKLIYTYYSAHAGDHPPISDLVKAAKSIMKGH